MFVSTANVMNLTSQRALQHREVAAEFIFVGTFCAKCRITDNRPLSGRSRILYRLSRAVESDRIAAAQREEVVMEKYSLHWVLAVVLALVGCTSTDEDLSRARCEALRDHLIELRLEQATEPP